MVIELCTNLGSGARAISPISTKPKGWTATKASDLLNINPGAWIESRKVSPDKTWAEPKGYWTHKSADGTNKRADYTSIPLTLVKAEKKGNNIKVTAQFDLGNLYAVNDTRNRNKAPKRLITRTFKADEYLKIHR